MKVLNIKYLNMKIINIRCDKTSKKIEIKSYACKKNEVQNLFTCKYVKCKFYKIKTFIIIVIILFIWKLKTIKLHLFYI